MIFQFTSCGNLSKLNSLSQTFPLSGAINTKILSCIKHYGLYSAFLLVGIWELCYHGHYHMCSIYWEKKYIYIIWGDNGI